MLRHDREPGMAVLVSRTYDIEPALELASEIAAMPGGDLIAELAAGLVAPAPREHRKLLNGKIPVEISTNRSEGADGSRLS